MLDQLAQAQSRSAVRAWLHTDASYSLCIAVDCKPWACSISETKSRNCARPRHRRLRYRSQAHKSH